MAPVEVRASATKDAALQPLGNRLPEAQSPHQSSQSVSVVERGDIEARSPAGVLDILGDVPGVSVTRSGGLGGQIFLRGFGSNDMRSAFFIDGDRFRGRNTLQFMLLAPEEIERVEVIRGPASSLYGSDALTGIVNIITQKTAAGDTSGPFRLVGGGASLLYGTNANTTDLHVDVEAAGHGFDFRADFTGRHANDYSTPQGTAINSDYKALGGSVKIGYTPAANQRIELTLRDETVWDGRAGGIGGAPGYPYTQVRENPVQVRAARLAYVGDLSGSLFQHVEASAYVNDFYTPLDTISNTYTNGVLRKTTTSTSYVIGPVVYGARALGTIAWGNGAWGSASTTIGADFFREQRPGSESRSSVVNYSATGAITSTSSSGRTKTGPDTSQMDLGAFVLQEWTPFPRLTLSASGRYDWINTQTDLSPLPSSALLPAFESQDDVNRTAPTGGVGLVFRTLPTLDLVGNLGTSYRAPTNSELYTSSVQGSGFLIPNPGLKPEQGVNLEGGFRWLPGNAALTMTAFHSTYRNLIVTRSGIAYEGTSSSQRQNVSHAQINGAEAEGRWQVSRSFNVFGNATFLRATNTDTGTALPYVAPLMGKVGVQYARPGNGLALIAEMNWAAAKTRIDSSQEYSTPGYTVFNLFGRFDLGRLVSNSLRNTTLTVGLENLFNAAYVSASTFANTTYGRSLTNPLLEPGRNLTLKLEHRL